MDLFVYSDIFEADHDTEEYSSSGFHYNVIKEKILVCSAVVEMQLQARFVVCSLIIGL